MMMWYNDRDIYLFEPVYWLNRDHCWIEWKKFKLTEGWWYLIWWVKQVYTDSKGEIKTSILPQGIFTLYAITIHQLNKLRHYRNKVRKIYNIYIKNKMQKYI